MWNVLPINAMIGNPLYTPMGTELKYTVAKAGEWCASYEIEIVRQGFAIELTEEGKLGKPKLIEDRVPGAYLINGGLYKNRFIAFRLFNRGFGLAFPKASSMDELVEKEFLQKTNYGEYFEMMGYEGFADELSSMIPNHNTLHYVTEKGQNKIMIYSRGGGNAKVTRKQEYVAKGLVPKPV